MKTSKYAMQTVGYFLLNLFQNTEKNGISVKEMLEAVGYTNYHNFWKCRLPIDWYKDTLETLGLYSDDLLVEVARVKGNHAADLHYHKISHAICIILGPNCGFRKVPFDSAVQIGSQVTEAYEDLECYFPVGCQHTFYGSASDLSDDGDLYFISIQNPPLLTDSGDDFHLVNND